jgi:GntP family gluconate:H+ symporter
MNDTLQLVLATLSGVAVIVVLIVVAKMHPMIALTLGSFTVGVVAWQNLNDTFTSFTTGVGTTLGGIGVLIGLGAMFGKLLFDSGGADQIVDTLVAHSTRATLPWTMAAVGALIGLPMFFEIGLVLLVPVVFLVSRRAEVPLMTVAIPTLAGLSVMHGFVPPHPGPLVAVANLQANLGVTLALGVAIAIPTVIVAGPLFAPLAARLVPVGAPALFSGDPADRGQARELEAGTAADVISRQAGPSRGATTGQATGIDEGEPARTTTSGARASFPVVVATVMLPVTLMLLKAVSDVVGGDPATEESIGWLHSAMDFIGTPLVALLIAVLVGMFTLGRPAGMGKNELSRTLEQALPPIAGILLIVGAGGGFKQTLIDSGVGEVITSFAKDSGISILFLGWLVAALVRLATGSATVATITASGILAPVAKSLDLTTGHTSLLVLAIGAGSLIFSHVNDAGFWLIKEFFGITVLENIKTWSVMETIISVVGLVLVLAVGIVV